MIEPRYNNLQRLFADRVFRIPAYQRFYSWQSKQRSELFSDLEKLAKSSNDQHHFMATIVCNRTADRIVDGTFEYVAYDIVDGQQRLTTLIILLKCMEDALPESSMERAQLAKMLVKQDGQLLLLQTNNANSHFFNSFISEGRAIPKEQIEFKSDFNLLSAITECRRFVGAWKTEGRLNDLVRIVLHRLGFVVFDTADSHTVYTLFEVLNSRGLAVDWLDKTKSALMGKAFDLTTSQAAQATVENLQKHWAKLYRELAKSDVLGEHVLQVTATLYYSPTERGRPQEKEDSLELLRASCTQLQDTERISQRLVDVAKILTELQLRPEQRVVGKILHARILYVALSLARGVSEQERRKLLDQWERVTFRIFGLLRKDSRTGIGDYVRLATKIMQGDVDHQTFQQMMEGLRSIGKGFFIDHAAGDEGLLHRQIYVEAPEVVQYVLWQYEEFLAKQNGLGVDVDEVERVTIWSLRPEQTIEHIYPQTHTPGNGWFGKLFPGRGSSDDENERFTNRIGNLVLLPRPLNASAGNRPFVEKKKAYDKHNLRMLREIVELEDWTGQSIEDRGRRLAEWAAKRWGDI